MIPPNGEQHYHPKSSIFSMSELIDKAIGLGYDYWISLVFHGHMILSYQDHPPGLHTIIYQEGQKIDTAA